MIEVMKADLACKELNQLGLKFRHFTVKWHSNLYPANTFILKISSDFKNAAYFQMYFRLDFFMGTNNMIPDQTDP